MKLFIGLLSLLFSQQAFAWSVYNATNMATMTDAKIKSIITLTAIGADHHPYAPAGSMGWKIGIDLSVEGTVFQLPSDISSAMESATGQSSFPKQIFIPKLNIRKGFPGGLDLGLSYISYNNNKYKVFGGDLQWNFLRPKLLPTAALRVSTNYASLFFVQARTTDVDLVISKKLAFIFEPYLGGGVQWVSGNLNAAFGGLTGLPTTVSASQSFTTGHMYLGLPIKFVLAKLTAEYDYSFSGLTTYGLKFGFAL